jgi:hypothetical protein
MLEAINFFAIFVICSICGLGLGLLMIVGFFLRRRPRAEHAWQVFATRTGLTFSVGKGYAKELVTGQFRGRALRLEYIDHINPFGADTLGTRLSLAVKNPARLGLTAETGAGIGKLGSVFGVAEVKLGDEALDRKYTFRSQPASLASQILLIPTIRQQLLEAAQVKLALDGENLQEDTLETIEDFDTLVKLANWLSDVADVLEPVLEKASQAQ